MSGIDREMSMKTKSRAVAAVVAAALLAGAVPSRAEPTQNVVYGFLLLIGVTLGVVAYNHDFGSDGEPLKIRDQSGREKKKEGARLELVPTPGRAVAVEEDVQQQEFAAGIAFSAKF